MQDIIVVAGGNSKRNLELANKFDQERYQVRICQSSESFSNTINEDNVIVVLLLYPDEFDLIKEIFACDMIKGDSVPIRLTQTPPTCSLGHRDGHRHPSSVTIWFFPSRCLSFSSCFPMTGRVLPILSALAGLTVLSARIAARPSNRFALSVDPAFWSAVPPVRRRAIKLLVAPTLRPLLIGSHNG